jgi:long-chain fatty acid transport protein
MTSSAVFLNGDGEVFLDLPDTLAVGIATQYFPRWILSFDLLWSGWGTYDQLKFYYEHKPYLGIPDTVTDPKDWKDVLAIRLGAEYLLNDYLNLRFSYVYDTSPINDKTRGAELPTNDRQLFSVGLGYKKKNLGLDFAYTYLIMEDSEPGEISYLEGEYEGNAHIFAIDIRYQF